MNFFDAQDHARKITRRLVVAYCVATLLIVAGVTAVTSAAIYGGAGVVANPSLLVGAACTTLLVIVGSSLYRVARLSSGGGQVAREMGGVLVDANDGDPLRRRYRNVVEEMAIASGVAVPEIYVLPNEPGINAFAAGYSPDDAAVAVTRGTLELLDRDELQGVIAHEFSHILNGDMRLNIRLMGVLFGIMVIGLIGRTILRGGSQSSGIRRRGKGVGGVVLVGLGLTILGFIGVFFARLIKAAVSRQREYLADASAVQFTRQTDGIANALKKIGGFQSHSYFQNEDAEQISHMLFAVGAKLSSMFATHPPLADRIRALEPGFDGSQFSSIDMSRQPEGVAPNPQAAGFAASDNSVDVKAQAVVNSIGNPGPTQIAYANRLHESIPEDLLAPARSSNQAYLLVLALLLSPEESIAGRQLDLLQQQLGRERCDLLRRYFKQASDLGPRYTLALLEISFPALRQSNKSQQEFLLDLGRKLLEIDGIIDLREFCLYRVLSRSLANAAAPRKTGKERSPGKKDIRRAAVSLIQLLARQGNSDPASQQSAMEAGLAEFGRWSTEVAEDGSPINLVDEFGTSLDVLQRLRGKAAETLMKAATATVLDDGRLTIAEAEMLRTVCASLGCPMPPVVAGLQVSH